MNPDSITLDNLSKSFEYAKQVAEIDNIEDIDIIKDVAKVYCKLYLKQQEVLQMVGVPN